ncbi:hypothetical protein Q5752_003488 [Cryptotrichosporon argae]
MSAPEASGTRQRTNQLSKDDDVKVENPASLGGSTKNVPRNKPQVKPPFADISVHRFLVYLILGLFALSGFYVWRFTVWASDVGGYWNLLTGHRDAPSSGVHRAADLAASAANIPGGAARRAKPTGGSRVSGGDDVQSQIWNLASALGVKPADLTAAIRPLIDPTVPNPLEEARREKELLQQKIELGQAEAKAKGDETGGLLGVLGEALLD